MLGRSLMVALAALLLISGRARADDAARLLLRRALDHYVAGRYKEAARTLRPLVEARVLRDVADQREALRTYGIALYLSGAIVGAERAFRDLLRVDSGARLDPSFVRPEVVSFFEDVRARYRAEQIALLRARGPRGPAIANLLPPWGQFQNRHRKKAYVLLGTELGLAAVSIGSAALLYSWRDDTGQFHDKERAATVLQAINRVSFIALGALLIYGIVDGLYHYYRRPD